MSSSNSEVVRMIGSECRNVKRFFSAVADVDKRPWLSPFAGSVGLMEVRTSSARSGNPDAMVETMSLDNPEQRRMSDTHCFTEFDMDIWRNF